VLPNGDVFPCHVLMQPDFRLGNIREQPLAAICFGGLLESLAGSRFADLGCSRDRGAV
jgi:radical SAM protein with 4Fe4S-binding SPASM domain